MSENAQMACMVTGHREFAIQKTDFVRQELTRYVLEAIADGYTHFVSGFATGADLTFAEVVIQQKNTYNITLEAAIPYRGRMYTKDVRFREAIKQCDNIVIYAESYDAGCYMLRNSGMVNKSSRIIAVYDNRGTGGTFNTITYANRHNKDVRIVNVEV